MEWDYYLFQARVVIKMNSMKTLEESVRILCDELKVPEPVEFLAQVMAGHDPRQLSDIYQMILDFEDQYGDGEVPDQWDWVELVVKIKEKYQFFPVILDQSFDAAKRIMEYTHAKKKQVDHSGHILDSDAVSPLTEKEVEIFMKKFNDEY